MLKSYKWMVWKSLKAPILRAPFCGANKSSNWAIVVVGVEIKVESSQQQWCYSIIVGVEIKVATSSRSRKKVVTGQQQFNSGSKNLSRRLPIVVVLQYYRRSRNKSSNWPKVVSGSKSRELPTRQQKSVVSHPPAQLVTQLDDLCYLYLGFCDDHQHQHPGNREIQYSNVLASLVW